jgi:hypothetical protein
MKKTIIALIILTVALFTSKQTSAQFNFGIKAGYNASNLSSSYDSISSALSSGFHAGVFARIGKRVHLQPELYYTVYGSSYENIGVKTISNWKQKVTVGTLDIPLLIGFDIIKSKMLKWRIDVGPAISIVLNSKIDDIYGPGAITTSDLNKANWYIQAGTGIDVWFLTLDIRYQAGLNSLISNVNSLTYTNQVYTIDTKGNLFLVSLGWKIF